MLRINSFEKQPNGTAIMVESDELMPDDPGTSWRYLLADGILETYLHHYGFPAGACFTALMLDAFYEDIDIPHWEGDFEEEFSRIVALGPERIEWHCDQNELLSAVTIDEDDPEQVAGTWLAVKKQNDMRAESFRKLEEERLADEFVTLMPNALRTQPRDQSISPPDGDVGLGIMFVP